VEIVVVIVVIVTMAMNDHNLVVVLIVMIMMKHDELVVLIVTVMVTNLDNFAMVPIPVFVLIADLDGYAAFLSDHDRLVDCGRPGQRRSAQDRKRARDKYQFVHVTFLHEVMLLPCAAVKRLLSVRLSVTRRGKPEKRWLVPPHSKKYACKSKIRPGMNTYSDILLAQRPIGH
jgi:hypothetical protein